MSKQSVLKIVMIKRNRNRIDPGSGCSVDTVDSIGLDLFVILLTLFRHKKVNTYI